MCIIQSISELPLFTALRLRKRLAAALVDEELNMCAICAQYVRFSVIRSQPLELSRVKPQPTAPREPALEAASMNPEYLGMHTILTTHMALSGALVEVEFCLADRAAKAVFLIGEMTDWQAAPMAMAMDKQGVWRIRLRLRHGQWLYKFIVDGKIIADPNNPLRADDGLGGQHSYVLLGDGDWAQRASTSYGEVVQIEIASQSMGENCQFQVYLPPNYDQFGSYRLLYLLHGYRTGVNQWASNGRICQFMGNLQAQGSISPFIIVMPATTSQEKAARYTQFLGEELYQWLLAHFPIAAGPANAAVAGMSQYEVNAFHLAMQFPGRFGFVVPISAFFSNQYLQQLQEQLQNEILRPPFALRLYCGTEDYAFARNQRFTEILRKNGVQFDYLPVHGEHTWHYWNSITRDVLIAVDEFFSGHYAQPFQAAALEKIVEDSADGIAARTTQHATSLLLDEVEKPIYE